ncbi:MAG TPA: YfhO family protein, partial [Acidimicrobiia bacterium]|nr:YfhO family protein [Acidimicrobiia bacterium]
TSRILDLLRITTVLVDPASTKPLPGADSLVRGGTPVPGSPLVRYDYQPRLPEAFIVGAARRAAQEEIAAGLSGRSPFDPAATALVDGDCRRCPGADQPGAAGTVQSVRRGDGSVDVAVTADRAGILVLSQAWFPGWQATVDGRPAPVMRVDGLVQGIPIDPGAHQIHLAYQAPGLRAGAAITGLTATGLLLYAGAARRRRRKAIAARDSSSSPSASPGRRAVSASR